MGKRGLNHQHRGPTKIQKNMRVEGKHHLLYCIFSVFLIWEIWVYNGNVIGLQWDTACLEPGGYQTHGLDQFIRRRDTVWNSAVYKGLKMAVNIMP